MITQTFVFHSFRLTNRGQNIKTDLLDEVQMSEGPIVLLLVYSVLK